jgi:aminopeptidase N
MPPYIKKSLFLLLAAFAVLCVLAGGSEAQEAFPAYGLFVSFDTGRNLLSGGCTITLPEGAEIHVGDLRVLSVRLNGMPLEPEIKDGAFTVGEGGTLEIEYEGVFNGGPGGVIGEEGISLTGAWYPSLDGLAYYSLKALLPEGFTAVSEAEEVTVRGNEYSFHFPHPRKDINLAAGRYVELKETFNGVDIYGYFLPEDAPLAEDYIESAKEYLAMYGELLRPYPYRRFSIVQNVLPTGQSMPTFILLGRDAVRLPFTVETPLDHEVLSQWFGNLVYCDCEQGNWVEGLNTYLADHRRSEREGEGRRYRKKLLTDYQSYVVPEPEEEEAALAYFQAGTDPASRAVGYGKGAMVFHMLKKLIGEEAFMGGLRTLVEEKKFREASWEDIRETFERAADRALGWFFEQWLNRGDVPDLKIRGPRAAFLGGEPSVQFDIIQRTPPYTLLIPVRIITDEGESTETLYMEGDVESFEVPARGTPLEMVLDEGYDIMRKLPEKEYPPVISRLLGDEKRLIVIPEEGEDRYGTLIDALEEEGFSTVQESEIRDKDISESSLLLLGLEGPVIRRLFGGSRDIMYECKAPPWECPGFTLVVRENPLNASGVVAVAYGDSKEEVDLAAKNIPHYGGYSLIGFKEGQNVIKEVREAEQGLRASLYEPVKGVQPKETLNLDEIIEDIVEKPIIYVGESHASFEDHRVQLEVIRAMHDKGRTFAIGMEMFQRPYQQAIDDYLSGEINEREFLKASEYFTRWQFDYNLYREILQYAKAKGIPVKALNLSTEVIRKVSREGLDALTEEEREEIPGDMDMTDSDYRERLEEVFSAHRTPMDFDHFYQSQILWDETMAHSVDEFLRENPGYQMVVLAGAGHIVYNSGIPKRVHRLNGKEYATLIPSREGTLQSNIGNYVLFPEPLPAPESPKLGVILGEEEGRVVIKKFTGAGRAEAAGLEEGDIITFIDDWKVEGIADVRIMLFDRKPGDTLRVSVLRKKFFGTKELVIPVTL